jgi:hypothetical protein
MSQRTADFVRDWVSENVHFVGYPTDDGIDPEAKALAVQFIAAAEAEGISRKDLEKECGDISSFLHGELERLADEEVRAKAARDD